MISALPVVPPPERKVKLAAWQGSAAAFVGLVAAQVVGSVVAGAVLLAMAVARGETDRERIEALESTLPVLLAATVGLQLTLAAFAFVTPLLARVRARDALGLRGARLVVFPLAVVGALGLGPLADTIMTGFSSVLPDVTLGALEDMIELFRESSWWLLFPFIALLPGFCEEVFFRGLLQRSLGNGAIAIAIASLAFAVIHLDPPHVVGVLPLGLYLGWVAARTGSVWVTIVVHVVNNAFALFAVHVDPLDVGYGTETPMPLWWTPTGLGLTLVCVLLILAATRSRAAEPR
jgi:membrane protease YdiL (CAAX protease family)